MKTAVYPGTFDPITNGHIDIIERALNIFDKVIIAISVDSMKNPLFTVEERIKMISEAVKDIQRIEIDSFSGLLVDYAKKINAIAVIRGLRAVSDFEYEFQMALMNKKLAPEVEQVFLTPDQKYTYLSSSLVKEVASLGGDISELVTPSVKKALRQRFGLD